MPEIIFAVAVVALFTAYLFFLRDYLRWFRYLFAWWWPFRKNTAITLIADSIVTGGSKKWTINTGFRSVNINLAHDPFRASRNGAVATIIINLDRDGSAEVTIERFRSTSMRNDRAETTDLTLWERARLWRAAKTLQRSYERKALAREAEELRRQAEKEKQGRDDVTKAVTDYLMGG